MSALGALAMTLLLVVPAGAGLGLLRPAGCRRGARLSVGARLASTRAAVALTWVRPETKQYVQGGDFSI